MMLDMSVENVVGIPLALLVGRVVKIAMALVEIDVDSKVLVASMLLSALVSMTVERVLMAVAVSVPMVTMAEVDVDASIETADVTIVLEISDAV